MKRLYCAIPGFSKKELEKLKKKFSLTLADERPDKEELARKARENEVMIIGYKERMDSDVYESAKALEILATLSVGTDHISQDFFEDPNIEILRVNEANVVSVAEHVFAFFLEFSKHLKAADKASREGEGRSGMARPVELYGKTLGVVGCGKIGRRVIELGNCFDMDVICWTFHPHKHQDVEVRFVSLSTLFEKSDFITVHLPLTNKSKEIVSQQMLSKLKDGAVFVNTSRAGVMDMEALRSKAEESRIYVGLDLEPEKVEDFKDLDNCILTPHIAGITEESIRRMNKEITDKILEAVSS